MEAENHGNRIQGGASFVSFCNNCGNETHKNHITGFGGSPQYRIYNCNICDVAIVYENRGAGWIQVYPKTPNLPSDSQIPERVRNLYSEAKLVERKSPSSFAIQIGRALEAMAKQQEAAGKTLSEKIRWLIAEGRLPGTFGEMAHVQRILRNLGAHDDEVEVDQEDVAILDDFFVAIIDYVYVAPNKVRSVQERIAAKFGSTNPTTSPS